MSIFSFEIEETIRDHAAMCYPEESCGFIINGMYVPKINHAPSGEFIIPPEEWPLDGTVIQAVIHSHPKGSTTPSRVDMQGQIQTGVTWGIISLELDPDTGEFHFSNIMYWGPMVETPPLIGRPFRHGPSGSDGAGDCFALVKDYYKTKGIEVPEFPRDAEWWSNGGDMYRDNFDQVGFKRISEYELQEGDAFLCQIMSPVPNHAGIFLNNPEDGIAVILHHLMNRLSRREPANIYRHCITHILRYDG